MTKTEFVREIAATTGVSIKNAKVFLDAYNEIVKNQVELGEEVATGLGTFKVVDRDARKCKNPRTGETVEVPAKKVVKFKLSTTVKNVVQ